MAHKKQKIKKTILHGAKALSVSALAGLFAEAVQFHQTGRIDAAKQIYGEILHIDPSHSETLHLLGVAHCQEGRYASARKYILRAIDINPRNMDFYNNLVVVLNHLGRPEEIIAWCRKVLQYHPRFVAAYSHMGNAMLMAGRKEAAIQAYRKALELDPSLPSPYNNMAHVLNMLNRPADAAHLCRRALELKPDFAEAYNNLAHALNLLNNPAEAIRCSRKALKLQPDFPEAYCNLAQALIMRKEYNAAIACCRQALELRPNFIEVYNAMGIAFHRINRDEDAFECFRKALAVEPAHADACNNMGNVYKELGKMQQAISCFEQALASRPDYAEAYNNLGHAYHKQRRFKHAAGAYRRALDIIPEYASAHNNLGNLFVDRGMAREAIACYHRAIKDPSGLGGDNNRGGGIGTPSPEFHSNLIFALLYDSQTTGALLLEECLQWETRWASSQVITCHENVPDPNRRLRVGYISPDFRQHAAAYFLEPLLSAHDHCVVEVFCYAEIRRPDEWTERFRNYADHWRETVGISDDALVEMIRSDRIDILVDGAGHSAGNRLSALTAKPAPIQVATLSGHGGATGLNAFDYVITDPHLTPPGNTSEFTEQILMLPRCYTSFRPLRDWPDVTPLPATETGKVVFGYFGAPVRIGFDTKDMWIKMINKIPGATLLLKHPTFEDVGVKEYFQKAFSALTDRLAIEDVPGGWGRNMDVYSRVDIGLDSFPMTGGTSTLIPIWMGVPVITLAGKTVAQRFGASLLFNAGIPELVAETPAGYIEKGIALAGDPARLAALRHRLRLQMASSPICDVNGITEETEAAYRKIWKTWCAEQTA